MAHGPNDAIPPQPDTLWDSITVNGLVPTDGFTGNRIMVVSSRGSIYVDDPGASAPGGGTFAQSFLIAQQGMRLAQGDGFDTVKLRRIVVRAEFPAAAGETVLIRFWKYHKDTPDSGFFIQQITDGFTYDSSDPWSWTINISSIIRNITMDIDHDALAMTLEYTPGGGPTLRAFHVDWDMQPVEKGSGDPLVEAAGHITTMMYPPV